jgi:hypothetical protein
MTDVVRIAAAALGLILLVIGGLIVLGLAVEALGQAVKWWRERS